jgi:outer membrane receptor protein involved in Fe transport
VEFETAYQITPQLTLNGNYTRTDAYFVNAGVWTYQIENARNMGNLGLTWTEPQFNLGTNLFITDHRRDPTGDFWAPGYARLDFFGRYHVTGDFDLYARVQNALDHHIVELIGYKNPGVYCIAGASYKFK